MMKDTTFADYVVEQAQGAGQVHAKAMFGGYTVYCEGKPVALICDDQLYIKPTEEGKKHIGQPEEAPPYKGAKPHFLIQEQIEDREWLANLIRITHDALPAKKPSKRKKAKRTEK